MPKRIAEKKRTALPEDWLAFVWRAQQNLTRAIHVLARLRIAEDTRKHMDEIRAACTKPSQELVDNVVPDLIAKWRDEVPPLLRHINNSQQPDDFVLDLLKNHVELAVDLTARELSELRGQWEHEVAEWGRAIFDRLGTTLQLADTKFHVETMRGVHGGSNRALADIAPRLGYSGERALLRVRNNKKAQHGLARLDRRLLRTDVAEKVGASPLATDATFGEVFGQLLIESLRSMKDNGAFAAAASTSLNDGVGPRSQRRRARTDKKRLKSS